MFSASRESVLFRTFTNRVVIEKVLVYLCNLSKDEVSSILFVLGVALTELKTFAFVQNW